MRRDSLCLAGLHPSIRLMLLATLLLAPVGGCSDDRTVQADGGLSDSFSGEAGRPDSGQPDAWQPGGTPAVTLPRASIRASELGLVINEDDPQSVAVGTYYQTKRGIPAANVVRLKFSAKTSVMDEATFKPLKAKLDKALGNNVQALALTWMLPYRVSCMSVTAAFSLGFNAKYCSKPCSPTAPVDYYSSRSTRPYTDHGFRPSMALAGVSEANVRKLIDTGTASEGTFPTSEGYFIRTTDRARSVRYYTFQQTVAAWQHAGGLELTYIDNSSGTSSDNYLSNKTDVLFYFTGLTKVPSLETNTYRPGAVADHLTSFGGQLKPASAGGQMSVLRWLEAGATGSYGTVVEPCNFTAKFPNTYYLLPFYFSGNTLVEAYWKSVQSPGEGIFVGDPLARPWGSKVTYEDGKLTIKTTALEPIRRYTLRGKNPVTGVYETVQAGISVSNFMVREIVVDPVRHPAYELVKD
jgi:uncharacterized protein (TIGR03790 family)